MVGKRIVVAITGTPAVGKTSFAKELAAKLPESEAIEINDVVDRYNLFSRVDKLGSKVVKLKDLESRLGEIIKERSKTHNLIIVGHLVPELQLGEDVIVVLRLGLKELISRLEAREYEKEKIRENLVSESVDYCGVKSRERCKEVYEIESEAEKSAMAEYLLKRSLGEHAVKPESKEISKFDELMSVITEGNEYGL